MKIPTTIIATAILASFLLAPVSLLAQTASSDWTRLASVTQGSKLSVKLKNGKKAEGPLRSVSDDGLSLTVKNATRELRREEIATVHELSSKSVKKATLIGLGVGAGVGGVAGIAADASSRDNSFEDLDNAVAAGLTVLGAAVGALAGFLVGRSGKKRVLIYEAK